MSAIVFLAAITVAVAIEDVHNSIQREEEANVSVLDSIINTNLHLIWIYQEPSSQARTSMVRWIY